MFKNIFGLAVLLRHLEALRRLIHGRLQPFRSVLSQRRSESNDVSLRDWRVRLCDVVGLSRASPNSSDTV